MAQYKITYFDAAGAAEPIRWIFSYGGIQFEDERIDKEKWPQMKDKTPFGQLPLLTDLKTGKVVNQSIPMAEFAAKKANLVGSNDWENLEIQAVVHSFVDMRPKLRDIFYETDSKAKQEKIKAFVNNEFKFYMKKFEGLMEKNNGYLAVGKLTWADIFFAASLEMLSTRFKDEVDIFNTYPKAEELYKKVISLPNIKKWLEKRPPSKV